MKEGESAIVELSDAKEILGPWVVRKSGWRFARRGEESARSCIAFHVGRASSEGGAAKVWALRNLFPRFVVGEISMKLVCVEKRARLREAGFVS